MMMNSKAPVLCVSLGTTTHGKWTYRTAVLYEAGTKKDGTLVWKKKEVLSEATTDVKIMRAAVRYATEFGCPFLPAVRHGDKVQEQVQVEQGQG